MARFLLVSLSITAILDEATIRKRREKLHLMISGLGLDGAYDATLDRIKGQGKGRSALGIAALMWISQSERPMQIGELCDALAVEIGSRDMDSDNIPSEKSLLTSCLGLVTVDESSTIRLVHFTLQEYFNSHFEHFNQPQATMAEVCLTYLNFDSIKKIPYSLSRAPAETRFLQYASSYWGLYARNGLTEEVKSLALRLLHKFDRHISAKLLIWGTFHRWERRRRHSNKFTGLHCLAYFGLDEIAIAWLEGERGCSADAADGQGRTPLRWAAEYGHEGMAKVLLDREEVNPDSQDDLDTTPLQCAAQGGHEGIVKLLLDREEVNPDSKNNSGTTPLVRAAQDGHEGIVKLLLGREEVNPDSKDYSCATPLLWAVRGGHEGIVKLLLDREEVNPDSKDYIGTTPLVCAAQDGHEGIVKLLLNCKEVHPNSKDNSGITPLQCAAKSGHEGIVKLLLNCKEVHPNSKDNSGTTPLHCAARGGHARIVQLLLDREEVNPDARDNHGRTPIWCAARRWHDEIVELLQGRSDAGPGTEADYPPLSSSSPSSSSSCSESGYEGSPDSDD